MRVPDVELQRVLVGRASDRALLEDRLADTGVDVEPLPGDESRPPSSGKDDRVPPPVLVVLDRPGDVGPIRELRSTLPEHPILALIRDGRAAPDDAVREAGGDAVLTLDGVGGEELLERLRDALERRALRSRVARLESRLRVSETRFHNTVQRVADGIMIVDPEGRVVFANAAAEDLFGRAADTLVGEEFGFPITAGETTEIDLVREDGEPAVAELRVTRTEWDDEDALLVSLRDVTSQREAEERKRELIRARAARREAEAAAERGEVLAEASRRLYASLDAEEVLSALADVTVEHAGDLVVVETLAPDLHIPRNRTVRAREGSDVPALLEALRGREGPILAGEAADRVIEHDETVVLDSDTDGWPPGLVTGPVGELVRKRGPRGILLTPLIVGNKIAGALAAVHFEDGRDGDVPDRALVEEFGRRAGLALENARLYRLANQASRAKSDFLNVVSHELRTPLTGIVGYTGLIEEGIAGPVPDDLETYLDGIERNSEQLLRIIDQILLFADTEEERQEVRYAEESVADLTSDVLSLAGPMAEKKGLELRTDVPEGDVRVRMDAGKVRQIVLHLLANAVKFTREGWILLGIEPRTDHLLITVEDTGIGIPEASQKEVFEPFNQIEASQTRVAGGMGIGLNVVKNLTRLLGGSIELESAPDEGSTFRVRLPLEAPSIEERGGAA